MMTTTSLRAHTRIDSLMLFIGRTPNCEPLMGHLGTPDGVPKLAAKVIDINAPAGEEVFEWVSIG